MKDNFSITCNDKEDIIKTLLALVGLGYHAPYLDSTIKGGVFNYHYVAVGVIDGKAMRFEEDELEELHFENFNDFLVWYLQPQETEQQKQIRELEDTIKKAQQQIEQLKQVKD